MNMPTSLPVAASNMLGICMAGWAAGKFAALQGDDKAIGTFCKYNLIPMGALVIASATPSAPSAVTVGQYALLTAGYLRAVVTSDEAAAKR